MTSKKASQEKVNAATKYDKTEITTTNPMPNKSRSCNSNHYSFDAAPKQKQLSCYYMMKAHQEQNNLKKLFQYMPSTLT